MPTYSRKHQLSGSLVYHIFNRSNARIPIFKRKEDFSYFKDLLSGYSSRFDLKIYHWVIMSNHYHLLLEITEPELISGFMAGLAKAYSCYHHKVYATSGLLWQGRFKMQPIQKERYLIACGRYIERNPVQAGMVEVTSEYPYSSARFYILGEDDGITVEDPAFLEFGKDLDTRRHAYMEFLRDFDDEEEKLFDDLEAPAGSKKFVKSLFKIKGRLLPKRRGRSIERIVV